MEEVVTGYLGKGLHSKTNAKPDFEPGLQATV
jgi:hypothetical protein